MYWILAQLSKSGFSEGLKPAGGSIAIRNAIMGIMNAIAPR